MQTLFDNHGRKIDYLRLAVTDRCNLRCFYCMPEKGVQFLRKKQLLSLEEQKRLLRILTVAGIRKVRITGGEPFVYPDIEALLDFLALELDIPKLRITTNGVLTEKYLPQFEKWGLEVVNLSLDGTDALSFERISRRKHFKSVWQTFQALLERGIRVKINAVITAGVNDNQLIPLARLAEEYPVEVRFIEEMPFNGVGARTDTLWWNYQRLRQSLTNAFGTLEPLPSQPSETAMRFGISGFKGYLGIIAAFSRTFCGTCNRLRVTADGTLKTCLYDDGVFNIRDLLRAHPKDDEPIRQKLTQALANRSKDGFEAENRRSSKSKITESMTQIGG